MGDATVTVSLDLGESVEADVTLVPEAAATQTRTAVPPSRARKFTRFSPRCSRYIDRTGTPLVFSVVCAAMLTLAGCAAWREGWTLHEYQGQVMSVRNGSSGAARLQMESDYDSTVRDFVQRNGQPDYIYVADRRTLQL